VIQISSRKYLELFKKGQGRKIVNQVLRRIFFQTLQAHFRNVYMALGINLASFKLTQP